VTLPTRERARMAVQIWDLIVKEHGDYPLLARVGFEVPALELLRARANGDLLTREEWLEVTHEMETK
jgi:hypothetical protein